MQLTYPASQSTSSQDRLEVGDNPGVESVATRGINKYNLFSNNDHTEAYGVWLKFSKDEICHNISLTLKVCVNLDLETAASVFKIPPNECFIAPVATMTTSSKSMETGEQHLSRPKPFPRHVAMNIQHCLTKPGLQEHTVVRYYACDLCGTKLTDRCLIAEYSDVDPDVFPTAGPVPDVFLTFHKKTRAIVVFTLYPVVVVCTSR